MADRLLLIEDEKLFGSEIARHYERQGWEVLLATSLAAAEKALAEDDYLPLVVLSDMTLPDGNALDLLEKSRPNDHCTEWVLLTGYGSVPDSVRALRLGAFDFLEKPCELDRLDLVVAGAARSARAHSRLRDEKQNQGSSFVPDAFLGDSPAAAEVRDFITKLSGLEFRTLVITGETGTGKGLVARILHHSGPRVMGPLIEVNSAALPAELLESELFGHEAGAFTGARGRHKGLMERAHRGTLVLDEISELDRGLQAKLLTAIDDRRFLRVGGSQPVEVDVQLVAASNQDLDALVRTGAFRKDLYHRLSVVRLHLPPLRQRLDDLADLVPACVAEFAAKSGKSIPKVPEPVWKELRSYDWPGNVRELRNVLERCILLSEGDALQLEWLQLGKKRPGPEASHSRTDEVTLRLDGSMTLDDMDRLIIHTALSQHDFNVTATARALGTTRETIRYRIRKHGLSGPNPRQ
jgi:DNA-binding NtrC family response regulator